MAKKKKSGLKRFWDEHWDEIMSVGGVLIGMILMLKGLKVI